MYRFYLCVNSSFVLLLGSYVPEAVLQSDYVVEDNVKFLILLLALPKSRDQACPTIPTLHDARD